MGRSCKSETKAYRGHNVDQDPAGLGIGPERAIAVVRDGVSQSRDMVYGQNPADPKSNTVLELSRMGKDAMLRETHIHS